MASHAAVCPVVGTTNTVLPPSHPDFDMNTPGLVCPVVGASTDHHRGLSKHPSVPGASSQDIHNAAACPVLKQAVNEPQNQTLSEAVCPVVGTVSSILPPDHPSTTGSKDGDVCPVTKASIGHHKNNVHQHPPVLNASKDAVCPVVGAGKR
ncbi:hypothetical protein K461DRAFT_283047 [Myriangium duriaei CBS 260.36]|uniref:Uncharacterized protein n=1 Tax=Myriangium duriaei CBS 260.36 TaxID=1168546 RepID=A0A9P4ITV2_9PEZI|nr:hypothetical protein K461DRAFT_283047 [Myriangium duriaei CBS 260.36]